MRLVPVFALMSSALALAACAGGGGGGSAIKAASISSGVKYCNPLTAVDTNPDSSNCKATDTGGGTTVTDDDSDGDGIPDDSSGGDGDGDTGSGAGGNATGLDAGNRTIALQKFVFDKPTSDIALSIVTSSVSPSFKGTSDDILSINKPKTIKYQIDTKSASNGEWAVPATMNEYAFGSRDLRWMSLGHTTIPAGTIANTVIDENGNPLTFDSGRRRLYYTIDDPSGDFAAGDEVDHTTDFFWNQLKPFMDARANGGSKTDYREYRVLSSAENRDELLQVWAWKDSYAMQYQNAIGGGEPKQQAWSFGGNKATSMPTGGTATYRGRFTGTAKTDSWVKPTDADIDPNALWMVEGRSTFNADFGTSAISGTLTPESWTSYQSKVSGLYTWYTSAADTPSASTVVEPDYKIIYGTKVNIAGTITSDGTTVTTTTGGVTTTTPVKNVFEGTASLSGTYISGDNPVYGGFFGTNGTELTGVFNVDGRNPNPQGGSTGINDNRRGVLIMNGAFNANCTPGVTCAP